MRENIRDREIKKRGRGWSTLGRHATAIREMLRGGMSVRSIADGFRVSISAIYGIRDRKKWSYVD